MKRVFSILIIIFTLLPTFAQKQVIKNTPYIDLRRFHYGFALGVSMTDVSFSHTGKDIFAECPDINPAFCVGLVGDLALTELVSVRCQPMLSFVSRDISFHNFSNNEIVKQDLKSCYLEIPLSIKVATKRLNNYRPYILAGGSIQYDLSKEKETPIVFNHLDYGIHIALGCDTYLPFFKFCPELRFNLGLADMIDHKRPGLKDETLMQYTDAISRANNKSISLIFYFE